MDIQREPKKKRSRYVYIGAAVAAIALITLGISRLPTADPTVERGTLWIDTVRRGEMVRQVRGPGTLVPEQQRLVVAITNGRIEALPVRSGQTVTKNTMIIQLSNPDVQLQALEAQQQLAAAEANLVSLRTQLETQRLNQEGVVAQIRTQQQQAERTYKVATSLDKQGLMSPNEIATAKDALTEATFRLKAEQQRLDVMTSSIKDQLRLSAAQVERLRSIDQFQQDRIASMNITAGADGVLQQATELQLGQYVNSGQQLASVAQPGKLKAVLRIPETQAKDVALGQPASIDTRNGIVSGHVMRIDPQAQNGTVTVEVGLEGALPKGARPDLSVDGTIEIERLPNVLYVQRPAYGQAESTVGIFKLEPDGNAADRVNVKLGRSSVNTIEIVQGLNPGDKVIVSDMSQWDSHSRVRIK